jgi:hypothetical protein
VVLQAPIAEIRPHGRSRPACGHADHHRRNRTRSAPHGPSRPACGHAGRESRNPCPVAGRGPHVVLPAPKAEIRPPWPMAAGMWSRRSRTPKSNEFHHPRAHGAASLRRSGDRTTWSPEDPSRKSSDNRWTQKVTRCYKFFIDSPLNQKF